MRSRAARRPAGRAVRRGRVAVLVASTLALATLLAGCSDSQTESVGGEGGSGGAAPSSTPTVTPDRRPTQSPSATASHPGTPSSPTTPPPVAHVVAVSVDGLAPRALVELGARRLPTWWRLVREGASTFNARTEVERTDTLPNHTGMLTGRRVEAGRGGHGVTFNDSVDSSIEEQTGVRPASVFDVVARAGGTGSLFTSKEKFEVFDRTWPSITRFHVETDNEALTTEAIADLTTHRRSFTFLHLSAPDVAGHTHRWLSPAYFDAVRATDANLRRLLEAIGGDGDLAGSTVVVVTADHGGDPHASLHTQRDDPDNYTIPFLAWGAGVPAGVDLYDLNPGRRDPGDGRPGYGPGGPIRNGDVANTALELLGLEPVPGSELGRDDPVRVR